MTGNTISDYRMTKADSDTGFFQSLVTAPEVSEESEKATLKNFTLKGNLTTTGSTSSAVGGVVGTTSGGVIKRVNSHVNIISGMLYGAGGIAGQINAQTSIQECTYSGRIVLNMDFYGAGGIVGVVYQDDSYPGCTIIKNCANYGEIDYYTAENVGGSGCSGGIAGLINISGKGMHSEVESIQIIGENHGYLTVAYHKLVNNKNLTILNRIYEIEWD